MESHRLKGMIGIFRIISLGLIIFNCSFLWSQGSDVLNFFTLGEFFNFSDFDNGIHPEKVVISYTDMATFTLVPISTNLLRERYYSVRVVLQNYDYVLKALPFIRKISEKKLEIIDFEEKYDNVRCVVDFYVNDEIKFSYAINFLGTSMIINGVYLKSDKDFFDFAFLYLPVYCYEEFAASGFLPDDFRKMEGEESTNSNSPEINPEMSTNSKTTKKTLIIKNYRSKFEVPINSKTMK